jgi:hypothetical protein
MNANVGDVLLLHGRTVGQHDRSAEIVEVLGTDAEGRGRDVRFRAAAMGRSTGLVATVIVSERDCPIIQTTKRIASADSSMKIDQGSTAPKASGANMSNAAVP